MPHPKFGEGITIRGLDGPAIQGIEWVISEGTTDLQHTLTKREAIEAARNTWAMPGQEIRLVNTKGQTKIVQAWDETKLPIEQPTEGNDLFGGGNGGLFGGGLF